jgi:large subunit ribosomal protein L10
MALPRITDAWTSFTTGLTFGDFLVGCICRRKRAGDIPQKPRRGRSPLYFTLEFYVTAIGPFFNFWIVCFVFSIRYKLSAISYIMALTKTKKKEIVAGLETDLKDANTIVFVNFKGLTVKNADALRKSLRGAGVSYKVSKKTLLKRVLDGKGITGDMPDLSGEVAIAYGTDALAPAREVFAFSKGKTTPGIVGGVFEGKYADKVQMIAIANIPPREVLLAQIAYLLKSPIQRLAIAVGQVAEKKA